MPDMSAVADTCDEMIQTRTVAYQCTLPYGHFEREGSPHMAPEDARSVSAYAAWKQARAEVVETNLASRLPRPVPQPGVQSMPKPQGLVVNPDPARFQPNYCGASMQASDNIRIACNLPLGHDGEHFYGRQVPVEPVGAGGQTTPLGSREYSRLLEEITDAPGTIRTRPEERPHNPAGVVDAGPGEMAAPLRSSRPEVFDQPYAPHPGERVAVEDPAVTIGDAIRRDPGARPFSITAVLDITIYEMDAVGAVEAARKLMADRVVEYFPEAEAVTVVSRARAL